MGLTLAVLLLSCPIRSLLAQEPDPDDMAERMMAASLEELLATPVEVWSATRTAETLESAPSVVDVVTARDIRLWGMRSVAEVLQYTLGFYLVDDHVFPDTAVRGVAGGLGSESGTIKVMVNGRSVAFRTTAGNWLGVELIPLSAIERIEIIRGPASALYGADAFLATVNIILKSPAAQNGALIRGALGSETGALDDLNGLSSLDRSIDVTTGAQWKKMGFLLSFAGERTFRDGLSLPATSPSPRIPDYNAERTASSSLRHDSRVFYGELRYTGNRGYLRLSGTGSGVERDGEFSQWTQLSTGVDEQGRRRGTTIDLTHGNVGLDGHLDAGDTMSLDLRLTYFSGGTGDNDAIEVGSSLFTIHRRFFYQGMNGVAEVHWTPHPRLDFVGGLEMLYDNERLAHHQRLDKSDDSVIGFIDAEPGRRQLVNPAAFLQVNAIAVPDLLKLTGGIRFDYHNVYGSQISGRAGAVFLWTETFTTKLLYGSAFKAPSPTLLYAVPLQPGDVIGNPHLKPQYVHTFELAPMLRLSRNVSLYAAVAYNLLLDKAEFQPDGINVTAENVSRVHGLSFEFGADMAYRDMISSFVSFELQRVVRDRSDEGYRAVLVGERGTVAPPWIFRLGFSTALPFLQPVPLRMGTRLMVVGERRASQENIVENGSPYTLPAFAMWDALLSFDGLSVLPQGETAIRLAAYNLLDVRGPDPGFAGVDYPLLPRRIMLELEQQF